MLKMIEVIGVSPDGYSNAVRRAVESIIATGQKVHFFEVVEQRGAVRDGQISEFQAKVKIAVDF
jgi:dodecin